MIVWSIVPYTLAVLLLGSLLFMGDTSSLSCLLLFGLLTAATGLIKQLVQQRRPIGSCLYFDSYGMPSGHASGSIGMMIYLLLEVWVDRPRTLFSHKVAASVGLLFTFGPVPYSRMYLNDHLPEQVLAGGCEGFVLALLWFGFMYRWMRTRLDGLVGAGGCCGLRNTYRSDGQAWLPELAATFSSSSDS